MSKLFTILIERYSYTVRTTIGKMFFVYIENFVDASPMPVKKEFGYTLEDTLRPYNIKVKKETGLPGGLRCDVSLYESDHYKKTIIFHTEPDKKTIKAGPLTWTSCLAHGGNDHGDTEGCVLVAENKIDNEHIQGSLKDDLRLKVEQMIAEGYTIKAEFVNLDQLN